MAVILTTDSVSLERALQWEMKTSHVNCPYSWGALSICNTCTTDITFQKGMVCGVNLTSGQLSTFQTDVWSEENGNVLVHGKQQCNTEETLTNIGSPE